MPFEIPDAETAVYNAQARLYSSHINDLANGIAGAGVVSGCAAAPGSGVLEIDIADGIVSMGGVQVDVAATTVTLSLNPSGENGNNARIDVVQANATTGVVDVNEGAVSSTPIEPDVNTDCVKLCAIYVVPDLETVTENELSDRRVDVSSGAALNRGLPSTSFIYNSSSLVQSGTRYNDWADLMAAVSDDRFSGPRNVLFEQDETIPAGAWNLDYITLLGNGQGQQFGVAAPASQIVVTIPTGVTISSWAFGKVAQGLKLKSTSSAPVMTIDDAATTLAIQLSYGFIECTAAEFFKLEADALVTGGPTLAFAISGGGAILDGGYEVVNAVADDPGYANVVMSMTGESGWVDADTVRGTGIYGQIVLHPAANGAISPTQANLTNIFDISALGTVATLIAYTPTTAGDWTDATPASLAAAIDELADRVKTLEP